MTLQRLLVVESVIPNIFFWCLSSNCRNQSEKLDSEMMAVRTAERLLKVRKSHRAAYLLHSRGGRGGGGSEGGEGAREEEGERGVVEVGRGRAGERWRRGRTGFRRNGETDESKEGGRETDKSREGGQTDGQGRGEAGGMGDGWSE